MCVVVLGIHVYAVRHPGGEFLSQGGAKSLRAGAVEGAVPCRDSRAELGRATEESKSDGCFIMILPMIHLMVGFDCYRI